MGERPSAEHLALIRRDEIIGWQAEARTARAEIVSLQAAMRAADERHTSELDEIKRSEAWRIGSALASAIGRFRPAKRLP